MVTVGVRDLKNQLSQYLQYVKNGEKVIVTEHNKIIAEIRIPKKTKTAMTFEEKLMQLSKEGEVILAKPNKLAPELPKVQEKLDWESVYNEVRADRL